MQCVFYPINGNKEGLSRKNLIQLLPDSDGPQLQGPGGRGPWVTVVGHEFEAFEGEFERMGGASRLLTLVYMNPYWRQFYEGMAKITEPERSKGPLQAPGPGHFIQKDNPELVENELREILKDSLSDSHLATPVEYLPRSCRILMRMIVSRVLLSILSM